MLSGGGAWLTIQNPRVPKLDVRVPEIRSGRFAIGRQARDSPLQASQLLAQNSPEAEARAPQPPRRARRTARPSPPPRSPIAGPQHQGHLLLSHRRRRRRRQPQQQPLHPTKRRGPARPRPHRSRHCGRHHSSSLQVLGHRCRRRSGDRRLRPSPSPASPLASMQAGGQDFKRLKEAPATHGRSSPLIGQTLLTARTLFVGLGPTGGALSVSTTTH